MSNARKILEAVTASRSQLAKLRHLSTTDLDTFINEFSMHYGSAAEIWMDEKRQAELAKLYSSNDWKCVSNVQSKERLIGGGWTLFDEEWNGGGEEHGSYDAVLYRERTAAAAPKAAWPPQPAAAPRSHFSHPANRSAVERKTADREEQSQQRRRK